MAMFWPFRVPPAPPGEGVEGYRQGRGMTRQRQSGNSNDSIGSQFYAQLLIIVLIRPAALFSGTNFRRAAAPRGLVRQIVKIFDGALTTPLL
ncbi:MAG: hypothetical protein M3Z21_01300 [Pseudomonadota bacterium]|nr:hypothetical protein [Pseudomonadota bacterium]